LPPELELPESDPPPVVGLPLTRPPPVLEAPPELEPDDELAPAPPEDPVLDTAPEELDELSGPPTSVAVFPHPEAATAMSPAHMWGAPIRMTATRMGDAQEWSEGFISRLNGCPSARASPEGPQFVAVMFRAAAGTTHCVGSHRYSG
jgi:hypothetical protein